MKHPSLSHLCKTAFSIGCVAYGGMANMVAVKRIFVTQKNWMQEHEFIDTLSLAYVLPGATSVSVMSHVGYKYHKFVGGILVPLFYVLPSVLLILGLSWAYFKFGELPQVHAVMAGLGSLVVAFLVHAIFHLGQSIFKPWDYSILKGFLIAALTFFGSFFTEIHTVWLILGSGILGILFFHFTHEFEHEIEATADTAPAMKLEKRLNRYDFWILGAVGILIAWLIVIPSLYRSLFLLFSHIGFLSFGGGYTGIPLMQHQIIDSFGWLTGAEFRDGLALSQVTPGPVSIVAAFIGYKLAGVTGGLISAFSIFLAPILTMMALSSFHAKVKHMKITRVIVKGFSTGLMGLLLATTLQFALFSLVSWQTGLLFGVGLAVMLRTHKDPLWLIGGTVAFSLFFI